MTPTRAGRCAPLRRPWPHAESVRVALQAGRGDQARALAGALQAVAGLDVVEVRGRLGLWRARPDVLHAVGGPPPRPRPCPAVGSVASLEKAPRGQAELLLCPSPFVARELAARHGVAPERTRVVPPAPSLPVGDAPPPAGPYVAAVGARGDGLREIGPGDDADALLRGAGVFVHAEPDAAFGMLALEAMARGIPVAAVARGALPDTCGGAAELFEPGDVAGAVARARARAPELVAAGRERVALFTWRATAEATALVYRELLGGRMSRSTRSA
jgi:glycosyltransferase involved in cell wall biosynthesis